MSKLAIKEKGVEANNSFKVCVKDKAEVISLTDKLNECKKYTGTIMNTITEILTNKKMEYSINTNKTEITVTHKGVERDKIKSLVLSKCDFQLSTLNLLVQMYQLENEVVIRLKRK